MFSKRMVLIIAVIIAIAVNTIALFITGNRYASHGMGRLAMAFVAPFQEGVTHSVQFAKGIWQHYFDLITVSYENDQLREALNRAVQENNLKRELELSNARLRSLLDFKNRIREKIVAAEVIGKDPSPWFRAIIIDKGSEEGVRKGQPVVMPEGIAGEVTDVSGHYAKVMLIIDRNAAVDALVQRTRARGIVKGETENRCSFKYVLRKNDVAIGDTVISSGLDGVFPKGQRIGYVSDIVRRDAGIFQEVTITPFVDFEKLEEVLVVLNPSEHGFESPR